MTERDHQDHERRRFFRIDDRVGLRLYRIAPQDEAEAIAQFEKADPSAGLLNDLRALRDANLAQFRSFERKYPTAATYMRTVEQQIDRLAFAIEASQARSADDPTDHSVNLSGQGLSMETNEIFTHGELVEIALVLYPDYIRIHTLGQVIAYEPSDEAGRVAFEFAYLRDSDREALVHHVHALQREQLQANRQH